MNLPEPAPNGTIFNLLDQFGIGWENYVDSYPTGATPELYSANVAVTEAAHHKSFDEFFTDAAGGTPPAFSLLDPDYSTQSQENPQNHRRRRSADVPGGAGAGRLPAMEEHAAAAHV